MLVDIELNENFPIAKAELMDLSSNRGLRVNRYIFLLSASLVSEVRPEIQQLSDVGSKQPRVPPDHGSLGRVAIVSGHN
jgi:hypothetical protein